ncbi:tRNA lysidine(34) synthetase TilS [Variovorax sp. Root434]|uniref:tRNA lysidine(34) synthetase TilS n=1 Tax=unclassified Variovorax TaxID=663243 RepID=UPI0006F5A16B|nr:tRNA lysidine(34) synthetase TilS [Variovorax sp. Root434]KQX29558.1 tRNA(Ile)-lysidine synthetase [Variovorax sp. Root434]
MNSAFERAIAAFEPAHWPLAVGFSGGADSTALLAACASRWPGQVVAFHVHHGLQAAADDFERHCRAVCERLGVPLVVHRVDARHAPGDSPEDAARRARYAAFAEMARADGARAAVKCVALGHHADDQVETLLLALSRGAGLPGLAAMPAQARRNGLDIRRPLLAVAGADIREWLAGRGLPWIEDPTNGDARYTRNRIRSVLMPALEQAFPQFRTTFARSIGHAAQAQQLLAELAAQDLETVGSPPRIATLQTLSRARQANVLRHWLMQSHGCAPSAAQLDQLLDQVRACTTRGHRIHLKVAAGFVERQGDFLHWYNVSPSPKTLL